MSAHNMLPRRPEIHAAGLLDQVHDGVDLLLSILRGDVKVGMLKVEKVRDQWSEAVPIAASSRIQVGDRIRLEPIVVRSDATWLSSQWYTEEWLAARLDAGQERYWDACEAFEPQDIRLTDGLRQLLASVVKRGSSDFG